MFEIGGRFTLDEFKQVLAKLQEERERKWNEEKARAMQILEKVTRAVEGKKPRKVLLTFLERPSEKYIEKLRRELVEWEKYPEWVIELESQPREVKRVVTLTRPIIIRRLLGEVKPPYPNVRRVQLRGVSNEWHIALIVPESRNLLQDLRLRLQNFRESEELKVDIGGIELEGFVAVPKYRLPNGETVGIGHIFYSDVPFLWTLFPVNAPSLAEASIKAVLIWNYHDEPMRLHIYNINHGTEDTVEIPPRSFLIYIHKFRETIPLMERKRNVEEIVKRLEEAGLSRELINKIRSFMASHGWYTLEELHKKLAEKQLRKMLQMQIEEIKRRLREASRGFMLAF